MTILYRWDTTTTPPSRVVLTADFCRDAIAQLENELLEAAFLPDSMTVGKRQTSRWKQDTRIQQQIALWNSRLYALTGGTEGKRPGCGTEHV